MSMNETAISLYEKDARFRAQVRSAVARATDECRSRVDGENIRWRDVHDVAMTAAILALKEAFDGDAEVTRLRIERDHYKKLAVIGLETRPISMIIKNDSQPGADGVG